MSNMYNNGAYLQNNPSWHSEDSLWKAEMITQILTKNKIQPTTIAEVGCGSGEVILNVQKKISSPTKISGFEISQDAYNLVKEKSNDDASFYLHDLLSADDTNFFDLLLVIDVIEHVENYPEFLRKCRTKATHKIFHIPLDFTVQKALRPHALMHNREKVGHIHYFTKETALAALKENGFNILDYNFTKWGLELPQKTFLKKAGKIPLHLLTMLSEDLAARVIGGCSLIILAE